MLSITFWKQQWKQAKQNKNLISQQFLPLRPVILNTESSLGAIQGCNQLSVRLAGPQLLSWPLSRFIKTKQSRSYRSVNTHDRSLSSTSSVSLQQRALSWLTPFTCHYFYCWDYVMVGTFCMRGGEPGGTAAGKHTLNQAVSPVATIPKTKWYHATY